MPSSPLISTSTLLFGIVLVTPGCIPFPHTVAVSPELSGTIYHMNEPVGGATISYVRRQSRDDPDCVESTVRATTNDQGIFRLDETKELRFLVVAGDELFYWSLCVNYADKDLLLWRNFDFGAIGSPYNIACDLTAELREWYGVGITRCTIKYCGGDKCVEIE